MNKPVTPIETMTGTGPVRCTPYIHWFAIRAKKGDKCVCGKTEKQSRKRKKSQ